MAITENSEAYLNVSTMMYRSQMFNFFVCNVLQVFIIIKVIIFMALSIIAFHGVEFVSPA